MSKTKTRRHKLAAAPQLVPELTMTAQFLPACGQCGAPHPATMKPKPADLDTCPACGANVATPAPVEVPAVITGRSPAALLARLFLWIGQKLRNLAKGL